MSMVINLVEDHNIYLCEGGPVYNGGVQPTPITYLTQWKIVGNSEVQGNDIWSCGEYNSSDGKYHILVQPLGGSIADIALTEPLRKVNDVADTIEFPSGTEGKALVTRNLDKDNLGSFSWRNLGTSTSGKYRVGSDDLKGKTKNTASSDVLANILCSRYDTITAQKANTCNRGISIGTTGLVAVYDEDYNQSDSAAAFKTAIDGVVLIYELATPTTELVDAPQIAEAESYTCVISQGAKAVEWSSFETE